MPAPTVMIRAKMVSRTANMALLLRLTEKCKEYAGRMADSRESLMQLDACYKYQILNQLLTQGVLNIEAIWAQHATKPGFNEKLFTNALKVIIEYNGDRSENIDPATGTGLT